MISLTKSNTIDEFLKWLEKNGKSDNTIFTYRREILKLQEWLSSNGDILLKEIKQNDIQTYIYELENQGKSSVTIDKILGVLRTFSKFIKKPEILFDLEVKPLEKKDEIDVLTEVECATLLSSIKKDNNKRNIAIVYMLLHTGVRVSELCALNLSDVDFDKKIVTIRSSTGSSRSIPLSDEANYYLNSYCKSNNIKDALFTSRRNERLTERSIQYILKKYNVHPHKLRHTFCHQLIDKGISLEVVSKLAGHKDINVTKRYSKSRIKELELEEAIHKTFYNDTLG